MKTSSCGHHSELQRARLLKEYEKALIQSYQKSDLLNSASLKR